MKRVFACLLFLACGDSATAPLALEEPLRVGYVVNSVRYDAQFFSGDLPKPSGGPAIFAVDVGPSQVAPGIQDKGGYTVRLAKNAYAVAVRLQGRTNGYWIARVDQAELLFDNQISASIFFDVAPNVEPSKYRIELAGVSQDQRFGETASAPLNVITRVPPSAPALIQLTWDNGVDFDLQLRAPDGTMLSPKRPTTAPQGTAADAGAPAGAGVLDGDSMAGCVDDNLRQENVVFATPPTPGTYGIYVNAFDLCRKLGANYVVSVLRSGAVTEKYYGRISELEVQQGGFGLGDFVANVTF